MAHDGDVNDGVDDLGSDAVRPLQRRTEYSRVSMAVHHRCQKTKTDRALVRCRYRTEASWQYAKGMAALCFASAALGLQVRFTRGNSPVDCFDRG